MCRLYLTLVAVDKPGQVRDRRQKDRGSSAVRRQTNVRGRSADEPEEAARSPRAQLPRASTAPAKLGQVEQQGQGLADSQQVDGSDVADHGGDATGRDGTDLLALGS